MRAAPIENATVVLVVDTSRSMLATDVAPTRLGAAKAAATTFLGRVESRIRVGLVTFSGDVKSPRRRRTTGTCCNGRSRRSTRSWAAGHGDRRRARASGGARARVVRRGGPARAGERADPRRGGRGEHPVPLRRPAESGHPPARRRGTARGAGRIPVYTVALGTDSPDAGNDGLSAASPACPTGRRSAPSQARPAASTSRRARARALSSAYDDLGSRLGRSEAEERGDVPLRRRGGRSRSRPRSGSRASGSRRSPDA